MRKILSRVSLLSPYENSPKVRRHKQLYITWEGRGIRQKSLIGTRNAMAERWFSPATLLNSPSSNHESKNTPAGLLRQGRVTGCVYMERGNANQVDCHRARRYSIFCPRKYPIVGTRDGVYSLWTPFVWRESTAKSGFSISRSQLRHHFAVRTRSEIPLSF